ncbi:TVP38/TMEM64 family protein [Microcoleus sp. ARI1-B5]|uniref:TVP38/TMEM64 family protein n=1 Tax=unclassified Microcoleus TaxID=2642155 RepID=UPI002FD2D806
MEPEANQISSRDIFKGRLLFLSIALSIALLIIATRSAYLQELLRTVLIQIEHLGIWGPVAFIATYNLATVLFIPGSVLTLGGGVLFGLWWGSIYVLIAATLGATFAFLIGRYLSRDRVVRYMEAHPKFKALDRAVAKEGFKIVFLTRLCPLFPFNLLNYALGITQVSLKDYVLGSSGMIPGTVMYVYSGSLVGNIAAICTVNQQANPQAELVKWLINTISFTAAVAVTVYITRIARKALDETV